MGYLKIPNLYKDQTILLFKECYALEKIHGTSAHISWSDNKLRFFSGGSTHDTFVSLFDQDSLINKFTEFFSNTPVTVYGEAYGGKLQGMRKTYGDSLRFIAFDVRVDKHTWLDVPSAEAVVKQLGLEFVPYTRSSTDIAVLDHLRDRPSIQGVRNSVEEPGPSEGIVLRPLVEMTMNNGDRVIAKHKGEAFKEHLRQPKVRPGEDLEIIKDAEMVAQQWVTPMRLEHVLDKLRVDGGEIGIERMPEVLKAMVQDILVEGEGEIEDTKPVRKAISAAAAKVFKKKLQSELREPCIDS